MSSILLKNENIPKFKDYQIHFDWLLEVTKDRKCKEIKPCVIRHMTDINLSLDSLYLKREFRNNIKKVSLIGKVRLCYRRLRKLGIPPASKAFDEIMIDLHWGQFLTSKIQIIISILIALEVYEVPRWFHSLGFIVGLIVLVFAGRIFRKTGKAKSFMRKQFDGIEIKNGDY